ncbi:hypothetical protein Btru_012454 [Bulinus truncatus]|nr:hypothetical protein Btru_012454 [Bulinus truncatus]
MWMKLMRLDVRVPPPRRDIDSVGVTWSFQLSSKKQLKSVKNLFGVIVVQDNYQGTGKPMADHSINRPATLSSQGLDLRGRHSGYPSRGDGHESRWAERLQSKMI